MSNSCQTYYLEPIVNNQTNIENISNTLKQDTSTFNDFISNFSNYSTLQVNGPITSCDNIPVRISGSQPTWTSQGSNWLNSNKIPSNAPEKRVCQVLYNNIQIDYKNLSSTLTDQTNRLNQLKNSKCLDNQDLKIIEQQYIKMVQKRKEMDNVVNDYTSKDKNTPINSNLQLTDQNLYTGMMLVVLATSALYVSFRYLNQ